MTDTVRLQAADIEAIARRTVELLRDAPTSSNALLTVRQTAERVGLGTEWVRLHADELGGVKLGSGSNAPWRFDPAKLADGLKPDRDSRKSAPADRQRRRPSRRRTSNGAPLLPIGALGERPKRGAGKV